MAATAMLFAPLAQAAADEVETLLFVRHGEKPAEGLGQLTCQGLNRALALPAVIAAKYGKPDAIYAPDPGEKKNDHGHSWYYVRPLATVEPTAIQFGMPVQTPWGEVRIKIGFRGDEVFNAVPEFEDCKALAAKAGVPLKDVQLAALQALKR